MVWVAMWWIVEKNKNKNRELLAEQEKQIQVFLEDFVQVFMEHKGLPPYKDWS